LILSYGGTPLGVLYSDRKGFMSVSVFILHPERMISMNVMGIMIFFT